MPESSSHKRTKTSAPGQSETKLPGGGRLDSRSPERATEVGRSPNMSSLQQAAHRLKISGAHQKVLQVPQQNIEKAADAMKKEGVSGTVKSMSGTKRRYVR